MLDYDDRALWNAIEVSLTDVALDIERDVVLWLEQNDHNVSGWLRNDVTSKVDMFPDRGVASIGNQVDYSLWFHEGTKPHWAPIGPLRNWVLQKFGGSAEEVDRIAKMVQRSIARKGTKAHPYLKEVAQQWESLLEPELAQRLRARLA